MKKFTVLFVLFIIPIFAYLFFATGVNKFMQLPTLTKNISNIGQWPSLNSEKVTLDKKITILGFAGKDILAQKGNYFNLNQKIYTKNSEFQDFQFVTIVPLGFENQVQQLVSELSAINKIPNWHFVFASDNDIKAFYSNLQLKENLNSNLSARNVFIIDKKLNLRGRKTNTFTNSSKDDYKEGYDASSPSDIYNQMNDDVKVVLAEYRLALKRNNNKRQI